MNGVDIGVGLHSRFSATEIINHISDELKKRITHRIKSISVTAVWYSYQALHSQFKKAQEDVKNRTTTERAMYRGLIKRLTSTQFLSDLAIMYKNRTTTERAMYRGLIKRLTSTQFLSDLAIMYDILAELSMVSECLQNRQTTVVYADKLIRRSIAFFECLIVKPGTKSLGAKRAAIEEKPGTKSLGAKRAAIEGNFCGVPLTSSSKITAINHQQLLSSVINNLNRRLLTILIEGFSPLEAASNHQQGLAITKKNIFHFFQNCKCFKAKAGHRKNQLDMEKKKSKRYVQDSG
ncbi:hypothetical protein QE152_g34162 [Popillia japonica]|uniref:Uncharacterized protein n=1 Tax=Popillia japonica TaxID=7064 RepID=A0AAW1IUQ4_POPJA